MAAGRRRAKCPVANKPQFVCEPPRDISGRSSFRLLVSPPRPLVPAPYPLPPPLTKNENRYALPPPKTMPMPEPNYIDVEEEVEEEEEGSHAGQIETPGGVDGARDGPRHRLGSTRAAWLERFCRAAAGDVVRSAETTVRIEKE